MKMQVTDFFHLFKKIILWRISFWQHFYNGYKASYRCLIFEVQKKKDKIKYSVAHLGIFILYSFSHLNILKIWLIKRKKKID